MDVINKSPFKTLDKTTFWFLATAAVCFILKYYHAMSSTQDLFFMLWPVNKIIQIVLNTETVYLKTGFYIPSLNILIDKSCSGANFFILTFCVLSSTAPYYLFNIRNSILLFVILFLVAYGLTIGVNAARILSVILLLPLQSNLPWITTRWFHQAEGAVIYLCALLIAYLVIKKVFIKIKTLYAKHSKSNMAFLY